MKKVMILLALAAVVGASTAEAKSCSSKGSCGKKVSCVSGACASGTSCTTGSCATGSTCATGSCTTKAKAKTVRRPGRR